MDRTFLLATPKRESAEWGYVAASRHRIDLQVCVAGADRETVLPELAAAWSRIQTNCLAIDRLDPPGRSGREGALTRDSQSGLEGRWER